MKKNSFLPVMFVVTVFAIAMALLESAVVIYLREIYYPGGFNFPLKAIDFHIGVVEVLREMATLVMLLTMAWLAGRNLSQRFAYFLLAFALWDIGYYIFLKLLIDWPASLLTWDVLFLIPLTWVGPVIAPVLLSLLMMMLAVALLHFGQYNTVRLIKREWMLLVAGSLVVLTSFMYDHFTALVENAGKTDLLVEENAFHLYFIPEGFLWSVFIPGILIILSGILHFIVRQTKGRRTLINGQWF